jgi:hypothetical protein
MAACTTLADMQVMGFDMDHTLVRYRQDPFGQLVFTQQKTFLFEFKRYPDTLLAVKWQPDQFVKGVVLDRPRGTLVKIDATKRVVQALHGSHQLSAAEIAAIYPDPLTEFDGARNSRWCAAIHFTWC